MHILKLKFVSLFHFIKQYRWSQPRSRQFHACFPSDDCRGIAVSFEIQAASSHLLSLISESTTIINRFFFKKLCPILNSFSTQTESFSQQAHAFIFPYRKQIIHPKDTGMVGIMFNPFLECFKYHFFPHEGKT